MGKGNKRERIKEGEGGINKKKKELKRRGRKGESGERK